MMKRALAKGEGPVADPMELSIAAESERVPQESATSPCALVSDWLDESPMATLLLDSNFRIVWVNRTLEGFFGLRRSEFLGKDKRELIRSTIQGFFEDPEMFAETVLATYDENTRFLSFECHLLPDARRKERWLLHWSKPIRGGDYAGGRVEHYTDITPRKRLETELLKEAETLSERVKELSCLLEISKITESHELSLKEALQAVVDRIPAAWQYPHLTGARLTLGGRQVQTENFRETVWRQSEEVPVNDNPKGTLEICYLEPDSRSPESPFLKEEQNLLHAIAQIVSGLAERHEAEQALRAREAELASRSVELAEVNTTLRVLLKQMSQEKRAIEARILASIERLVLPYLSKLNKGRLDPDQRAQLKVVEANLRHITSPFTEAFFAKYSKFSPTEMDVANFIQAGESTQQIADLLHVSVRTVESHRLSIRKKLGLKGRKVNLKTCLLSTDSDYNF